MQMWDGWRRQGGDACQIQRLRLQPLDLMKSLTIRSLPDTRVCLGRDLVQRGA